MHVGAVGPVHVSALCAFHLVSVLFVVGSSDAAMAATLLAPVIHVTDLDGGAAAALPLPIPLVHRPPPLGARGSMVSGRHWTVTVTMTPPGLRAVVTRENSP